MEGRDPMEFRRNRPDYEQFEGSQDEYNSVSVTSKRLEMHRNSMEKAYASSSPSHQKKYKMPATTHRSSHRANDGR